MDVIDLSRPQTQKILVLQIVQFRVVGNSWGYGCSVLYRALFFKWISIFITVGGYLWWGFVFQGVGHFILYRVYSFHGWACIQCVGHLIFV